MNITLIVLVSLLSCGGQLCQKQAAQEAGHRRRLLLWIGLSVLLLGMGMLAWLLVLQYAAVSIAYPMLSLNFIFVTLAARVIWKEPVPVSHWLGVVLVIFGVIALGGQI